MHFPLTLLSLLAVPPAQVRDLFTSCIPSRCISAHPAACACARACVFVCVCMFVIVQVLEVMAGIDSLNFAETAMLIDLFKVIKHLDIHMVVGAVVMEVECDVESGRGRARACSTRFAFS